MKSPRRKSVVLLIDGHEVKARPGDTVDVKALLDVRPVGGIDVTGHLDVIVPVKIVAVV